MSIDQEKVIDSINLDENSGEVLLAITDHLSWDKDINEHLLKLQNKIKAYLAFIDGGEFKEKYPTYSNKNILISVIGKYSLNKIAQEFYTHWSSVVSKEGIKLKFSLYKEE